MLNYDDVITIFENHIGGLINDNMSYKAAKKYLHNLLNQKDLHNEY